MKPHKHAHLVAQYATDLGEDNTAYRKWQCRRIGAVDAGPWTQCTNHPSWQEDWEYRRIPTAMKFGGYVVYQPEKTAPATGAVYYVPSTNTPGSWMYSTYKWAGSYNDVRRLNDGLVFLTASHAHVMAAAMVDTAYAAASAAALD